MENAQNAIKPFILMNLMVSVNSEQLRIVSKWNPIRTDVCSVVGVTGRIKVMVSFVRKLLT
jgi:hypothetical protein